MIKRYKRYKKTAEKVINETVGFFSSIYEVKIKRISIRNQKTRWGSCSKRGNLNFNYKLVFLPEELRNYVIVHEICHILEFNHSTRFWYQVSRTFPNYKELRKKLRKTPISKKMILKLD